ncbi:MAG TPA: hypothetical protein RMH99_10635 [Sandaracinaceae bacterium LLY-WYZ-13_1]|nr:hypothetical protein [Sandaracinaceae bacterium LLY-WYZ-13_1]
MLGRSLASASGILAALLTTTGCYLSHQRPDGGGPPSDAGQPVDADADASCGPDDIRIEASLLFGPHGRDGRGSMIVESRSGETLFRDGHGGDHRFELCVPREEAPLDLSFPSHGNPNYVLGVDSDFSHGMWSVSRPLSLSDPEPGRLVRQEEGSAFVVHLAAHLVERITESPFLRGCRTWLDRCQIRFLEVASDGRLLGAGSLEHTPSDSDDDEMVLDARGPLSTVEASFEVRLPRAGVLAGLELTEVWPLDCSRPLVGPVLPGQLDLARCRYAGVASWVLAGDRVAQGTLTYITGPEIHTDRLVARLGDPEEGLEALALVPCCNPGEMSVVEFGEVNALEGSGARAGDLSARIDAPGFEHAFVYTDHARFTNRIWDYHTDGSLIVTSEALPPFFVERYRDVSPAEEVWIGAVTTGDAPPWSAGMLVRSVRRRVVP